MLNERMCTPHLRRAELYEKRTIKCLLPNCGCRKFKGVRQCLNEKKNTSKTFKYFTK